MAPEISVDSFWNLLRQSGLVADHPLAALTEEFQGQTTTPLSSRKLAEELVRRNVITQWQADMLLQGKHRGFRLGPYRILRPLGHGGMSKVFLAEHEFMRRLCAIKVLPAKYQDDADLLNRFHLEARAIAALDHPHIVRAYDFNKDDRYGKGKEIHYLAMEFVEGQDLRRMVEEQGPLECRKAADLISQAAEGLEHAHNSGFVHRDIKPANLLVDPNGVLKILDLGLARFTFEGEAWQTPEGEQSAVGTADYVAPEQVLDPRNADGRADIYGLGHTLYFMLTGRRPFPKATLVELLKAHQSEKPESILKFRPDVPLELVDIYERMTAKNPAQRFQTAQEVVDAIQSWLRNSASGREYSRISALMQAAMKSKNPSGSSDSLTAPASMGNTNLELAFLDDEPMPAGKPASPKSATENRDDKGTKKPGSSSSKIPAGSSPRVAGSSSTKVGSSSTSKIIKKAVPATGTKPKTPSSSSPVLATAEELVELMPDELALPEEELAAASELANPLQPLYRRRRGWQAVLTSPWLWVAVGGTIVVLFLLIFLLASGSSQNDTYMPVDSHEPPASRTTSDSATPKPASLFPEALSTTSTDPSADATAATQEKSNASSPTERQPDPIVLSPARPNQATAPTADATKPATVALDRNQLLAGVKNVSFRLQSFGDPKFRMMIERQASEALKIADLGLTTGDYPVLDIELRGGNTNEGFAVGLTGSLKVRIPDGRIAIIWQDSKVLATMPRRVATDQALKVLRPKVGDFFDGLVGDIRQARKAVAAQ